MSKSQSAREHHGIDLHGLSPVEGLGKALGRVFDPFGITTSMLNAQAAWLAHPQELSRVFSDISGDLIALQLHILHRACGLQSEDVVKPNPDDSRFADPVWEESPTWDIVKEWYLAITHRVEDMLYVTPGLSGKERRRAAFWMRKWLNAMAPTNFFWSNPVALRKFVESRGASLSAGLENFMHDIQSGTISMVDTRPFQVGKNLGNTPGTVVFRNRLVEVIQYTPTTEQVHAMPIVIVTPWINKYYILDLNEKKSLVRYLVGKGYTVFITSWRNPSPDMAEVGYDDYITEGIGEVIEAARAITRSKQVHAVGYCLGGTGLATYMALANRRHARPEDVPVAHWTLFTTLVDFAHPGDIEVFIDDNSIDWLTRNMATKGFLDGKDMASSFRMLRSNSLIWHYWEHNYLYGETPPPFDVLYWNTDSTRMPYRMHAYYLREMYQHNNLIRKDALTIAGQPIDLERIVQPLYAVAAEDDHIAPWKQTFRIRSAVACPVRYVLSTSGHILGIVNPPVKPAKRAYWVGAPERNENADHWKAQAEQREGSWWEDWTHWLAPQAGPLVAPPSVGNSRYKPLGAAPGEYVLAP